jgi:hypothetical protein
LKREAMLVSTSGCYHRFCDFHWEADCHTRKNGVNDGRWGFPEDLFQRHGNKGREKRLA